MNESRVADAVLEGADAQRTYAKPLHARDLPSFHIPESNLGMGASLGNSSVWIHTKGTGAIERVFLNEAGMQLVGAVLNRYGAQARPIESALTPRSSEGSDVYSGLYPEHGSRQFEIHPAYQNVHFTLGSVIDIDETTFLPIGAALPGREDAPIVYTSIRLKNKDGIAHHMRTIASAVLRGTTDADICVAYDDSINALIAWNEHRPEWVRIFGLSEKPTRYGSDFDFAATYDPSHVHPLTNEVVARGDVIGRLQLDVSLQPGEERRFHVTVGLYACGREEAVKRYASREHEYDALEHTKMHLEDVIARGRVLTPDAVINHGALWSKVNMRRVMATYPTGRSFTNDPGKYANIVVRDCAWFVYGNDHFLPEFSRDVLNNIASRQYSSGKMPEYFDAVTGTVEDDGLNINDDTPLYILAVNHHYRASGDARWLKSSYPSVARAARYIISQIDDRGLVYCSANDPRGDVWAIAGWRNIIAGYSINGAVTEINAECVAALRAAGHLAENAGGPQKDRDEFFAAAQRLKNAMDKHLINPDNGLYYLNVDVQGNAHTDVTGDQIFPVIMRACSDETGFGIISRLNCPDFWTAAGLRTVSRHDPRYDSAAAAGLLGGVWPGLTWWYAFGAARYHPEIMVKALRSSFEHYGASPKRNNTVPGQFSEWFDGESLENRGMRLSPWEPPRFLWAAVEGVCGMMLSPGAPRINPLIPPHWSWVGLRNLPYHGAFLSYFLVREHSSGFRVYSTVAVDSDWDVTVYSRDVTDQIRVFADNAVAIALAGSDATGILVGNTGPGTIHTPMTVADEALPGSRFTVRMYNSERDAWEEGRSVTADELRSTALYIEAGGFRLFEISADSSSR